MATLPPDICPDPIPPTDQVASERHDAPTTMYTEGEYLDRNPTWHVEDSPWKANHILNVIHRHELNPRTVCEIGCGAGEILVQMSRELPSDCEFWGYDISPQAHALAKQRENDRLHFRLGDVTEDEGTRFDLALVIDLIEHLDDYYSFLRKLQPRSEYKIFHFPLDLSAYSVFRSHPILHMRESVGHIHYFSCDTALAALRGTGYEIVDWFYPDDDDPPGRLPFRQKILSILREALFKLAPDATVRLLGGRSLMVLAR